MKDKFSRWMNTRYGMDELGKFLGIGGLIVYAIGAIFGLSLLAWIGIFMIIYFLYRMLSSKIFERKQENQSFLRVIKLYKLKWENRKEAKIYMCKSCGKYVRVPRGKGKIEVTCRNCGARFVKRT